MKTKTVLILLIVLGASLVAGNVINQSNKAPDLVKQTPDPTIQDVPLPSAEDVIRLFFQLINDDQIDEAITMMSVEKGQNWRPYLESFEKVEVTNLKKTELGSYQVNLDVKMKPESEHQPIPYFGYVNGANIRYINLIKDNNLWKIKDIATGP